MAAEFASIVGYCLYCWIFSSRKNAKVLLHLLPAKSICARARISWNSKNCIFVTGWPWHLTYDLDLQTWPRYYQGQSLYRILWPYAKRFSCESATWLTHWHTHTDISVFITWTADAGGKNTYSFDILTSCSLLIIHTQTKWTALYLLEIVVD